MTGFSSGRPEQQITDKHGNPIPIFEFDFTDSTSLSFSAATAQRTSLTANAMYMVTAWPETTSNAVPYIHWKVGDNTVTADATSPIYGVTQESQLNDPHPLIVRINSDQTDLSIVPATHIVGTIDIAVNIIRIV